MFPHLRQSLRSLRRAGGFSAASVLMIGLAAGANAAILAVLYGILLKPLPYAAPDRLVAIWPDRFQSNADLLYLREQARGFSSIAAVAPGWSMSLTGAGEPAKMTVARTSGNLFETLGAPAALGRTFTEEHARPGAPAVAVLGHAFWATRFAGDPGVVGRTVRLEGDPVEIIGVMPPEFEVFGLRTDAYTPLTMDAAAWYHPLAFSLYVGRLAPGATLEAADREYRALIPRVRAARNYPEAYGQTARLQDLRTAVTGASRVPLLVLGGAVSLILLIAGANVGTLLLVRASGRRTEMAIRTAIGASRGRLARELLTESAVLAAVGAALGLALAYALLPSLVALLPADTPRTAEIAIDGTVAAVVFVVAAFIGLVFGAAPVAATLRIHAGALMRSATSSESRQSRRVRSTLVTCEIALALVLTIGAGLMLQTLWRLHRVTPGFDAGAVLTMHLQPSGEKYTNTSVAEYYDRLLERLRALPGVSAAGAIQHLPFSGFSWTGALDIEGTVVAAGASKPTAGLRIVTPGYFDAIGQPLLAGRPIERPDAGGTNVVVNERLARAHFGSAAAAPGRRLRIAGPRAPGPWLSVVGVVGDVRHRALTTAVEPEIYTSVSRTSINAMMLAIRTGGNPGALAPSVRAAVWSIDPDVPVSDVRTMRTRIDASLGQPRLLVVLLMAFAGLGVLLAAMGVYGVVAHSVAQQRREIGIKLALGAERGRVVREVLRSGLKYAAAGIPLGVAGAAAATRVMASVLFGVTPADPLTFAAVAALTAAVVAAACLVPAWRASRTEPLEALRS